MNLRDIIEKRKKPQMQTGVILEIENNTFKAKAVRGVLLAVLCIWCCIAIVPIMWIFLSSFKDIKEFYSIPPTFIPKTFHPEKLVEVWNSMNLLRGYRNSFTVILGELVTGLFFNGIAGYVLSRLKPKGYKFVLTLVLWTMLLPNSVSMVPLFMTFIDLPILHVNMTNSFLPFWLMAGANSYFILVFKSFFDSISQSYIEAARIDGCNNLGIFFRIIMPLSKSAFVVIALFIINSAWGSFMYPYLLLRDPEKYTVAVQLFAFKTAADKPLDMYFVALIFSILPPAILFAVFNKHIMTGFSLGGVKE